ncbi:AraC family transcriptional regulator [Roseovarius sp.]|uniref:AraC family transcriptional regulator n=1 Tax=Roseovarius sp. TaxID=1486281 RepID=UPI003B5B9B82
MSPNGQRTLQQVERADRPLVGYAEYLQPGFFKGFHSHPRAQVMHPLSGVMRVVIDTATFVVMPSTALFVPARVDHSIEVEGPVEMRTLFLTHGVSGRIGETARVITVSPLLQQLIIAASSEPLDWELSGRGHHIAELALDEIGSAADLKLMIRLPKSPLAQDAARLVLDEAEGTHSIEDLAERLHVSSRTLTRLFQKETGLSLAQWRQQVRLTRALEALVRGATPKEAAHLGGYKSVSAFGVALRTGFGLTPGAARKLYENSGDQFVSDLG